MTKRKGLERLQRRRAPADPPSLREGARRAAGSTAPDLKIACQPRPRRLCRPYRIRVVCAVWASSESPEAAVRPGRAGAADSTRGRMTAPFAAFLARAKRSTQGVCGRKEGMRVAGRELCERGRCETMALQRAPLEWRRGNAPPSFRVAMLGSPEKIRFAAFRIARTDFHVGRSRANRNRRGAAAPPEWFFIPVSPNIGAPRLVSDRPSRALQAARARPKRVQHVQQDDHRRLPSGRNPGGGVTR